MNHIPYGFYPLILGDWPPGHQHIPGRMHREDHREGVLGVAEDFFGAGLGVGFAAGNMLLWMDYGLWWIMIMDIKMDSLMDIMDIICYIN